ncbi:hypothetical protein TIFTF001_009055 [Ficus carica]|uniref:Uncharacterized protein n=1 Tax=Ficus carica TaxID=3494 RepID=A0AA88D3B5_FICCA|nr:hypothetical protein TIFTF001_009055 [Ficus carica]
MGNVLGRFISILWKKLCKACDWVVSKLKKFVNYLSEKIKNLVNRAKRFYDNLTERAKESFAKAKRLIDKKLKKIIDSVAWLKKKLKSGVEVVKEK